MMYPFKPENVRATEISKETVAEAGNYGFWMAAIPLTFFAGFLTMLAASFGVSAEKEFNENKELRKRIQELEEELQMDSEG